MITSTNPLTLTILGSTALTATFSPVEYSLDIDIVGDGHIVSQVPDQSSYHYGDVVTVTVSPEPGWFLVGWSGDATGSELSIEIPIGGNMTVVATFDTNRIFLPIVVK